MNKLKRAMPFIITGLLVVTIFVMEFTQMTKTGAPLSSIIYKTLMLSAIIVFAALAWMASGIDRAKNEDTSAYNRNVEEYSKRVTDIEKRGSFGTLAEFCKLKTQEMLDSKIRAMLSGVCIDRSTYDNELKMQTKDKLLQAGYNKKQIKIIEQIRNEKIKVKEINALELTTNSKAKGAYDVHYDETADRALSLALRVVKSVISGLVLSLIAFELAASIKDITAWTFFLTKLMTIAYTAWSSEREGYEQITNTKNKVILRRISFLNLFNEWASVPLLNISKGE